MFRQCFVEQQFYFQKDGALQICLNILFSFFKY